MSNVGDMINSYTKSLDEYLKIEPGVTYIIPFSQRNYEWRKQDVHRLFNDLISLYNTDSNDMHMLNFFTFSKTDEGNLKIFDGQQRTVTCLLLLAVIAQKLYKGGKTKAADQIRKSYFETHDELRTDNIQKKIKFDSVEDDEFFYKITAQDFDISSIKDILKGSDLNKNQRNMATNIGYLNELLDTFVQENLISDLGALSVAITDKTFLVEFIANTEDIALSMFESLNNTGKNIEKYYVLKNDMVKCLGENAVKEVWQSIDFNLSELNTNAFLIAVGTMFAGKTTTSKELDNLYSNTNKENPQDMQKLLVLLKNASNKFLKICNPNQMEDSNKFELRRYKNISDKIHMFGMRQHRPIILAMLMKNDSLAEINEILNEVLKLTIKNFYFGEEKANTIEKKFADFAREIYSGIISVEALKERIIKLSINDSKLKVTVENKNITQNNKIAYILREVYNNEFKDNELEVSVQNNDLEHILPKTPKKEWLSWFNDEDERKKLTNSIGNMTLWLYTDNRAAKNAQFDVKKKVYAESGLPENKRISKMKKWTSKEIQDRSEQLADKIVKTFR